VGRALAPPKRRARGFRLTERDRAIAAFIDRLGYATAEQVAERFGLSQRMSWRRLQALGEHGQLRNARLLDGPGVYYTPGTSKPKVRDLEHTLAVNWVVLQLELAGLEVVTERRMRQADRAGQPGRWSIPMASDYISGRQRTHRPDLVARIADAQIPVEVELTRKSRRRLQELMGAWARRALYSQVVYLCGSIATRDLVVRQARRAGADLIVRAALYQPRAAASPSVLCGALEPGGANL